MTSNKKRRWWEKKSLDEIIVEHIADHRLRLLDAEHNVERAIANRNATRDAVDRLMIYRRQLRWSERLDSPVVAPERTIKTP